MCISSKLLICAILLLLGTWIQNLRNNTLKSYPFIIQAKAASHCIKGILKTSQNTEFGPLCLPEDLKRMHELPEPLVATILHPWPPVLRAALRAALSEEYAPTLCMESRTRLQLCMPGMHETQLAEGRSSKKEGPEKMLIKGIDVYEMPRFFRWVVPFHLAGANQRSLSGTVFFIPRGTFGSQPWKLDRKKSGNVLSAGT